MNDRYYALQSCAAGSESYIDGTEGQPADPNAPGYIGIKHGYFGQALLDVLDTLKGDPKITTRGLYEGVKYALKAVLEQGKRENGQGLGAKTAADIDPSELTARKTTRRKIKGKCDRIRAGFTVKV